ncbi:MAG: anaerobic carbon-monoxide dehydrogenase catalytic subunit [Candidatus Poribacteria bacterium]
MQALLNQERELRRKGFFDKQTEEMVEYLRGEGIQTVWDVQNAYDSSFLGLKDRCAFGSRGLCCRNCAMGPCRLGSDDFPFHIRPSIPSLDRSTCGKTVDTMVAGTFLSSVERGTSAHVGHAIHVAKSLEKAAEGEGCYEIKDEEKLKRVASSLGIQGDDKNGLAKKVARTALDDLLGSGDEPMNFAIALAPKHIDKVTSAKLIPNKGAAERIVESVHSSSMGTMSNTFELLRSSLQLGVIDVVGLYIATQLQDILFGTPSPTVSKIGLDVLDEKKVNVVVHGHVPLLSEKVVQFAHQLEDKAKAAGADGINVVGLCCTGNEVLMRHGIPLAGSNLQQELVIGTGLVDAIVVDVQCIYPALSSISQKYQTKLITTMKEGRMENELHIPFHADNADEAAEKIVQEAIDAYNSRSKTFLPSAKSNELIAGFSVEGVLNVLSKLNETDPLKPLVDLIADGSIQGAVLLAGCTSPKVQSDASHVTIAKELIQNNILVVSTGCAAQALARHGLLTSQAADLAGDSLKGVLSTLGETAGLNAPLPPVWHFGSCVDNSRIIALIAALADYLDTSIDKLPIAASCPEWVTEKALAIGSGALSLGVTAHLGVTPQIGGSEAVIKAFTEGLEGVLGSRVIVAIEPSDAAKQLMNHVQTKRRDMGLE